MTPDLRDRDHAIAWMDAERLNLSAAAEAAAALGHDGHVQGLAAAVHGFLRRRGYWDQAIAMHRLALRRARNTGDHSAAAAELTSLAELEVLTGSYLAASASLADALHLFRELGNELGEASALNELGALRQLNGDLPAAESATCHQQALRIYRSLGSKHGEASALNELGNVQHAMAGYPAAAASH